MACAWAQRAPQPCACHPRHLHERCPGPGQIGPIGPDLGQKIPRISRSPSLASTAASARRWAPRAAPSPAALARRSGLLRLQPRRGHLRQGAEGPAALPRGAHRRRARPDPHRPRRPGQCRGVASASAGGCGAGRPSSAQVRSSVLRARPPHTARSPGLRRDDEQPERPGPSHWMSFSRENHERRRAGLQRVAMAAGSSAPPAGLIRPVSNARRTQPARVERLAQP